MSDPTQLLGVKKRTTSILLKASTIASYAEPRNKKMMEILRLDAEIIFLEMKMVGNGWTRLRGIEEFCNRVNSIQFNFKKKGRRFTLNLELPDIHLHH